MTDDASFVALAGSERGPLPAAEVTGVVDPAERIELTLVTRRMAELPRDAAGAPVRLSREELHQRCGSDPAEQGLVADVLASSAPASRSPAAIRAAAGSPSPARSRRSLSCSAPRSAWSPAPARTERR